MGDVATRQEAIDAVVMASRQPCSSLDLTLGRSGTLLAASLLLEAIGAAPYVDLDALIALGTDTLTGLWAELDAMPPVGEAATMSYLGIAHGWAGVVLASLRWSRAAGVPLPRCLVERLDQLAALAQPAGRGDRWPIRSDTRNGTSAMAGWCHGSAGYIYLWTTAHEALGDDRWAVLAERSASDACTTANAIAQLCCGQPGQAYGLLALYRHTGEPSWLTSARERPQTVRQGWRVPPSPRVCTRALPGSPYSPSTSAIRSLRLCRSSGRRRETGCSLRLRPR
jgi:eukaryotic-like serine/threonine-protein kinase